eukprot:TRINITY_DN9379_c0_g1_i1.p1 TRINITY_DN9379_c0_g1~~TRINITY_DN9379_c0_g1_i1.p1  ORF type:complete len:906 (+),score=108.16 TRINITY_DN9379_c0_g1_i1:187-2904(+)
MNRAKSIPLKPFINYLKESPKNKLIITGFSQGSAVGELITLRLLKSPAFSPFWIKNKQLFFIGFGSPLVGDKFLSSSIISAATEDQRWNNLFYHIVNQNDVVPRLLMLTNRDSPEINPWLRTLIQTKIIPNDTIHSVVDVIKAVADIVLPEFDVTHGHWLFLDRTEDSGRCIYFDASNAEDVKKLRDKLLWKGLKTIDVQHHNPLNYYTSLTTCGLIYGKQALKVRHEKLLAPEIQYSTAKYFPKKREVFVTLSGRNLPFFQSVSIDGFKEDQVKLICFDEIVDELIVKISNVEEHAFRILRKLVLRLRAVYSDYNDTYIIDSIEEYGFNRDSQIPITALLQVASLHEMIFLNSNDPQTKTELMLMDSILNVPDNLDGNLAKFNTQDQVILARVYAWLVINKYLPDTFKGVERWKDGLDGFMLALKSKINSRTFAKLESLVQSAKTTDTQFDYYMRLSLTDVVNYLRHNLPPLIGYGTLVNMYHKARKESTQGQSVPPSITAFYLTLHPVIFLAAIEITTGQFPVLHHVHFEWYQAAFKYTIGAVVRLFNPKFMIDKYVESIELDYRARVTRIHEMIRKNPTSPNFHDMEAEVVKYVEIQEVEKTGKIIDKMFPPEFSASDIDNVKKFFPIIRRFHGLRTMLKSRSLLSFIGPQKSGKSTAIARIFGLNTGALADVNTIEPTAYFAKSVTRIPIFDWPAFTDQEPARVEMQKLTLPFSAACVIVVPLQNANESPVLNLLQLVHDEMDCPFIILFNKVDVLYQEIKNDIAQASKTTDDLSFLLQGGSITEDEKKEAWERFWKRVNQFANEITNHYPKAAGRIFPTCFSQEAIKFLHNERVGSVWSKYDDPSVKEKGLGFVVETNVIYSWPGVKRIVAAKLSESIPKDLEKEWQILVGEQLPASGKK